MPMFIWVAHVGTGNVVRVHAETEGRLQVSSSIATTLFS